MAEPARKLESTDAYTEEDKYVEVIHLPKGKYFIQRGFNSTEDGQLNNGGAFEDADVIDLESKKEVIYDGMKFVRKGRVNKKKA